MNTEQTQTTKQEQEFLTRIHENAVHEILSGYCAFTKTDLSMLLKDVELLSPFFDNLRQKYFNGLAVSQGLARQAHDGSRFNAKRVSYDNPAMKRYRDGLEAHFPQAGNIWVLDGLVMQEQHAGVKQLVGLDDNEGLIVDVLNSAASISLGAGNPWAVKMDYVEDILGVRDNVCAAYHPGVRQAFALKQLAALYPNKTVTELTVHAESSGTIVNSVAIESAIAYVEKRDKSKNKRILAVDGSWAGGYGSSREGTGFGVDDYQVKKAGKNIWVDRLLPPPTTANSQAFLNVIRAQMQKGELAGVYLEPDVAGDLGLITVDTGLLQEMKTLLRMYNLPIILDCVQQLGRSGGYWGENVAGIFADYPLLIVTTAKSASNGQPFGFTVMPKAIGDAAQPLSQITTNQMNGPLLRALVVAEVLNNPEFQEWLDQKSQDIVEAAARYGFHEGHHGLRGKYLNRGIYLEDDEHVKLAQIALLIEDGILVGATPHTIRYQPTLTEYSETNRLVAEIIFKRLKAVQQGNVSPAVLDVFKKMHGTTTGLARQNT